MKKNEEMYRNVNVNIGIRNDVTRPKPQGKDYK